MAQRSTRAEQSKSRAFVVFCVYGTLSAAAIVAAALTGRSALFRVGDPSCALPLVFIPLSGLAVGLIFVGLSQWSARRLQWAKSLHHSLRALMGPMSDREILVIAAASAIGEELFFRGLLMPWVGLWAQALIFALLHLGPSRKFLPWTLSSFVMGVVFGQLSLTTGNIGAAIVAHFTINFLNLLFITKSFRKSNQEWIGTF